LIFLSAIKFPALCSTGLATWFVGASFGVVVSILSAVDTTTISILSGQHYSNRFAPIWNAAIVLSFYFIVVWLLRRIRLTQQTLEQRVKEGLPVLLRNSPNADGWKTKFWRLARESSDGSDSISMIVYASTSPAPL
jgi:hypothetical protein